MDGDVCPCREGLQSYRNQVKSSQVKSSQVKSSQVKSSQVEGGSGSMGGIKKGKHRRGKQKNSAAQRQAMASALKTTGRARGRDRRRNMRRAGQLTRTLRGMGYPYRTFIVCSTGPITHTCLISANVTRRRPGTRPPASTALLDSTSVDLPFSLFILLSPTDRYSPLIFTLLSYLTRPVLLTYLFTEGT